MAHSSAAFVAYSLSFRAISTVSAKLVQAGTGGPTRTVRSCFVVRFVFVQENALLLSGFEHGHKNVSLCIIP